MARFCKYIILLFALICPICSCQEGREAGDLLGQWRLKGSDTQYVSFSGSVALFRMTDDTEIYGKFKHIGDSLFIEYVSVEGIPSDTAVVENNFGFKPFDNTRLKIDKLDSQDLVLSKDGKTWSFYKY